MFKTTISFSLFFMLILSFAVVYINVCVSSIQRDCIATCFDRSLLILSVCA